MVIRSGLGKQVWPKPRELVLSTVSTVPACVMALTAVPTEALLRDHLKVAVPPGWWISKR